MAKAKTKRKTKAKTKPPTLRGHNSASAEDDAEMLKVAKAQRSLDKKRDTARAEWKEEQSKLTARLKEIGMSRKAFGLPYANWMALQDAEDDDAAKQAREKNIVYLAQQRRAYQRAECRNSTGLDQLG